MNKYLIYQAILEALPNCNYVKDLEAILAKKRLKLSTNTKGGQQNYKESVLSLENINIRAVTSTENFQLIICRNSFTIKG